MEQYLKLPVAYHGAVLRHSLVDGHAAGPRQWHQDIEACRPRLSMRHFPVERVRQALLEIVPRWTHEHVFAWRETRRAAKFAAQPPPPPNP